jgi:hypothetical protein
LKRWGRNQEVPGEDPYANGRFGVEYTRGLQEVPQLLHSVAFSVAFSAALQGSKRHCTYALVRLSACPPQRLSASTCAYALRAALCTAYYYSNSFLT